MSVLKRRAAKRKRDDSLKAQLAEVTADRDRWKENAQRLQRERIGEVWLWQGDGEDHLESLACPILITADQLREELEEAYAKGKEVNA